MSGEKTTNRELLNDEVTAPVGQWLSPKTGLGLYLRRTRRTLLFLSQLSWFV